LDLFAVARRVGPATESIFVLVELVDESVFDLLVALVCTSRDARNHVASDAHSCHVGVRIRFAKCGEGLVANSAAVVVDI
jgi:hypothetical protein